MIMSNVHLGLFHGPPMQQIPTDAEYKQLNQLKLRMAKGQRKTQTYIHMGKYGTRKHDYQGSNQECFFLKSFS